MNAPALARNTGLPKIILVVGLYLSWIRAANIGWAYPADERMLGDIDYFMQTMTNFVLIAMVLGYFFLSNNYRLIVKWMTSIWVLPLVVICLLSVAFSVDIKQAAKFTLAIIAIWTFTALYWQVYGLDKLLKSMANFAMVMSFVNMAYVLAFPGYGIMVNERDGAWRGMFDHKNMSGPFFAIGCVFMYDQLCRGAYRYRLPVFAAMGICALFVLLSKSSTAIVCFLVILLLYHLLLLILRINKPMERVAIFLGIICLLVLVWLFGGQLLMDMFFEATGKDPTLTGRTAIWGALLKLTQAKPLLGYGLGMAQRPEFMALARGAVTFEVASSHNSYLDVVLNIGYPGAVIFMLLVFSKLYGAINVPCTKQNQLRSGALMISIMAMLLMVSFTTADVMLGRSVFSLFTFITLLIATSLIESGRVKKTETS